MADTTNEPLVPVVTLATIHGTDPVNHAKAIRIVAKASPTNVVLWINPVSNDQDYFQRAIKLTRADAERLHASIGRWLENDRG